MIAALMIYGVVVGTLVAIGGTAVEWLARRFEIPARAVWAGALLVLVAFIGLAPYRGSTLQSITLTESGAQSLPAPTTPVAGFSFTSFADGIVGIERSVLVEPIERSIALAQSRLPQSAGNYLIALWLIASVALVALMLVVHLRFNRDRRHWPVATLFGVNVRIAPQAGPAVIGIVHPDIVVPRWLLGRSDDEQRLVIAHENEHMWARDPMLLVFGWTVAAILPWNPAAWWMLSRLRLAVELDCDARVLSRGVAPRKYGDLLIDLAEQRSGFRVSVAALADDSSHLQQRLMAMKPDFPRFVRARAVLLSALAVTALLVACETAMPTASDVNKLDAESAERAARRASILKMTDTAAVYTVDGVVVTAAQARNMQADKIASVDIAGSMDKRKAEIRIVTAALAARTGASAKFREPSSGAKVVPLTLIDGVKATQAQYESLDPKTIKSVRVTKGGAAKQFSDPLAANGVIEITTKPKN